MADSPEVVVSNLRMVGALLVLAGVAWLIVEAPFSASSGSPDVPFIGSYAPIPSRGEVLGASAEASEPRVEQVATQAASILIEAEPAETEDSASGNEWLEMTDSYETDEEIEE